MSAERLPPGLPRPQQPFGSLELVDEQLRRMALYLRTAAVLEAEGERCRPSPAGAVLFECARVRREKAIEIRDRLTATRVPITWPGSAVRRPTDGIRGDAPA